MRKERDVRFTLGTVGEGGTNGGGLQGDVWTVQKLLLAAGVSVGVDGVYKRGGDTAKALLKFQEQWEDAVGEEFGLPPANKRDPLTLLRADDDWLLRMAAAAQLLIPMPEENDIDGVLELHKWLKSKKIKYERAADYLGKNSRSFWPIHGRRDLAIQLQPGAGMINRGPIQINCTSYANMMLSVYLYGDISNSWYNPLCGDIGASSSVHLAKDRYHFKPKTRDHIRKDGKPIMGKDGKPEQLTYFRSPQEIRAVVEPWEIYSMEIGSLEGHGTGHHAILYTGMVYESRDAVPSATDRTLDDFFKALTTDWARWIYLFGEQ
jgi:hypothetical protein